MAATETILFSSVFTVRSVDKNGKKFDKGMGGAGQDAQAPLIEFHSPRSEPARVRRGDGWGRHGRV